MRRQTTYIKHNEDSKSAEGIRFQADLISHNNQPLQIEKNAQNCGISGPVSSKPLFMRSSLKKTMSTKVSHTGIGNTENKALTSSGNLIGVT